LDEAISEEKLNLVQKLGTEQDNEDDDMGSMDVEKNENDTARRVLQRFQQKLSGYDGKEYLAVSGQVQLLIHQATKPSFLSELFAGWAPWL